MTLTGCAQKLAFLVFMAVTIAACGDGSEPEPPRKAPGLRKRIAVPPTAEAPGKEEQIKPSTEEGRPGNQDNDSVADIVQPAFPDRREVMEPPKSEGLKLAEGLGKKKVSFYDPRGKIDPFESPFTAQTEQVSPRVEKAKEKRVPVTPLQRISLGQLELVAVVLAPSGNKALVEDPSGKGYIVSHGTYVGQNYGRIKQILEDRIVVEEEVEDFVSRSMKTRTRELKLHKKVGDV